MKKLFLSLLFLLFLAFVACDKDDDISVTSVQINMTMPASLEGKNATLQSTVLTITNMNNGVETKQDFSSATIPPFDVEDGLYNILVEGEVQYATENAEGQEVSKTETVRASKENVTVVGGTIKVEINLFLFKKSNGFVISEILFTGTRTPEDKPYGRDTYIEIYNNTSEVLYADGLCIADSEFYTSLVRAQLSPDIRAYYTAVANVYRIPGDGTKYPIEPGEVFILCDQGINHNTENANSSIDLSGAKFEWFDENTKDIDVSEVPNLIKVVTSSKIYWPLHNKGFTSYVLFKMDNVTPEQFAIEFTYTFDYVAFSNGVPVPKSVNTWKVPNDKIIDAVECSTLSAFEWKALDPSLDLSWTHSGDGGNERYGKSVKRKVDRVEGDRKILLDTNDSRFDFIPTADPSPGVIE